MKKKKNIHKIFFIFWKISFLNDYVVFWSNNKNYLLSSDSKSCLMKIYTKTILWVYSFQALRDAIECVRKIIIN